MAISIERTSNKDLVFAVLGNDLTLASTLLRQGADPDSRAEWDGVKAIDRANERDFDAMVELLAENGGTLEVPPQELRKGFKWKSPKFGEG